MSRAYSSSSSGHRLDVRIIGPRWSERTPTQNQAITRGFQRGPNTTVVRFLYQVEGAGTATTGTWRHGEVLMNAPDAMTNQDILRILSDELRHNFQLFGAEGVSGHNVIPSVDPVTGYIRGFNIIERSRIMNNRDILAALGLSTGSHMPPTNLRPPGGAPMFGYLDDRRPYHHRAFRYMIEGCDMKTLQGLVESPQEHDHQHASDGHLCCDRMCVYKMLADLNTPSGHVQPIKVFRPENVNRWMNENGHAVGGLCDGVTSDAMQAHAVHFRYGHCAMDLTRSVVNLYIPFDRNHHYKTACYVITGDHCQPIVDANVVKSIMKSASQRIGRRRVTSGYENSHKAIMSDEQREMSHQTTQRRKRHRSLDRLFRPEYEKSEERQNQDLCQALPDLEKDDWEEEFDDDGNAGTVSMGTQANNRRPYELPMASDRDRIHLYTLETDRHIIEEKCKPTYREGDEAHKIHYYICTDQDDVEFLYHYLVRVLGIDPLRYARSFNGRCHHLRMQNTWWYAHRDAEAMLGLHVALHPKEPFRMMGLASYGFRMLQHELFKMTKKSGTVWECMSHYSPNLQRLLDTHHPYNRPKILQCTYRPPYSNPLDVMSKNDDTVPNVTELIPMALRRRIDLIRSYASTIWNLSDDEYPIHDSTNRVVPFNEDLHGSLPIGHYLVDLPTEEDIRKDKETADQRIEEWKRLPCFRLGEPRMMSHRMLRSLIHRNLLEKSHVRLVCLTDPTRQKKYGLALVQAMKTVVEKVYNNPELQTLCPKNLVNHFVGLCNGTTVPHSGMRYVFHDMHHLVSLLTGMISEDQLQRIKVLHTTGHDPTWRRDFDYYEIDSSGLAYRAFHLQPVFNMVLEDQALRIFDLARDIPLGNLIQINVDAIEYSLDGSPENPRIPKWAQTISEQAVDSDVYAGITPEVMLRDHMGRYKWESPKDATKAMTYYYKYNQSAMHHTRVRRYLHDAPRVEDPESTDYVDDWKNGLRSVVLKKTDEDPSGIQRVLIELFTEDDQDRSGLLVTGAAGTGKTFFVGQLCSFALNLDKKVVKTAFTHAACVQMGYDAVTINSLLGIDDKTDVRATLVTSRRFMSQLRCLDIDLLIIDEISMLPLNLLEALSVFHRVSSKTRFVCVGDFNQLPPVEPMWERGDAYTYFDHTDIFPYLLYDRVLNKSGRWLCMTECKRTNDPLLVRLCHDPVSAQSIQYVDFPMPPSGIPIWRFICWRNSTRKACNFYCGHRYLQMYPECQRKRFVLRDLWAEQRIKQEETKQTNPRTRRLRGETSSGVAVSDEPIVESSPDGGSVESLLDVYRAKYDSLTYRPSHWLYLQNFTYATGMEVVCRNTMREYLGDSPCVNNRRAVIQNIDDQQKTIVLRWSDVIRRAYEALPDKETVNPVLRENTEDADTSADIRDLDVTLSFFDFAFNFIPGFCITAHMAQGETIREHYGILEWQDMSSMPRMAYVAVTRGSSSQLLHLVPPYSDPWNSSDTSRLEDNVVRKLYHMFRWDKKQSYEMDVSDVVQRLSVDSVPVNCKICSCVLQLVKYSPVNSRDQFGFSAKDSLSPRDCSIVCEGCRRSQWSNKAPLVST